MSLKSNFEFLDDILLDIYETKGRGKSIVGVFKSFYGHSPISDTKSSLNFGTQFPDLINKSYSIDDFFNRHDTLDYEFLKIKQAIIYLESEKLIYRITDKDYDLTYLGIAKLSKTFVDDYKEERFEKYFNRTTITISLLVSTIGLALTVIFSKC